jgi:hypothetical protein
MPVHRRNISNAIKKRLRAEAGHKCANPGCPNRRTHIHHIREWAVYQTHDEQHMIAVCPTCHDAIHNGDIPLDDDVIYRWKSIRRDAKEVRSHIYVEPSHQPKLLLGSIGITTTSQVLVFELSRFNRLKFSIKEKEIMLLELSVATLAGHEVLRVTDNYVRYNERSDVEFKHVPGAVKVVVPASEEFVPTWAVRHQDPFWPTIGPMTLLAISVLKPGLVHVQGVWAETDNAIVATKDLLGFLLPNRNDSLILIGDGESSEVRYVAVSGVIDPPLFRFNKRSLLNFAPQRS